MATATELINQGAVLMARGHNEHGFEQTRMAMTRIYHAHGQGERRRAAHVVRVAPIAVAEPRAHEEQQAAAFLCPFLVDTEHEQTSWALLLPVALFNMALAYHREMVTTASPEQDEKRQGLLCTMQRTYQQALACWEVLFDDEQQLLQSQLVVSDESLAQVHAAILINLIHVETLLEARREVLLDLRQDLQRALTLVPHGPFSPFYQFLNERVRVSSCCFDCTSAAAAA